MVKIEIVELDVNVINKLFFTIILYLSLLHIFGNKLFIEFF